MTLTLGTGPFGRDSAGSFNFERTGPAHVLYWHDHPRRLRAVFGGATLFDSRRGKLLHETGLLPVLYVPFEDVDADLLEASELTTRCPFKGDASYFTVRAAGRVAADAAWHYPDPIDGCPPIAGHVAVPFDAMDAWYEEDEQVHGHLRDPFHRVDVRRGSQRVQVRFADETIADSTRPMLLFETGLPVRYYLPLDDIVTARLEPSDTVTSCPYKGTASYRSIRVGEHAVADAAFGYGDPLPEAAAVADHWCFLADDLDIEVT